MNWKKKKDTPEAQTPEAAAAGKGPVPFLKKNWKWLVPVACVVLWDVVSGRGRLFLPPSLRFMVMTPVFRSSENCVTCRLSK